MQEFDHLFNNKKNRLAYSSFLSIFSFICVILSSAALTFMIVALNLRYYESSLFNITAIIALTAMICCTLAFVIWSDFVRSDTSKKLTEALKNRPVVLLDGREGYAYDYRLSCSRVKLSFLDGSHGEFSADICRLKDGAEFPSFDTQLGSKSPDEALSILNERIERRKLSTILLATFTGLSWLAIQNLKPFDISELDAFVPLILAFPIYFVLWLAANILTSVGQKQAWLKRKYREDIWMDHNGNVVKIIDVSLFGGWARVESNGTVYDVSRRVLNKQNKE